MKFKQRSESTETIMYHIGNGLLRHFINWPNAYKSNKFTDLTQSAHFCTCANIINWF